MSFQNFKSKDLTINLVSPCTGVYSTRRLHSHVLVYTARARVPDISIGRRSADWPSDRSCIIRFIYTQAWTSPQIFGRHFRANYKPGAFIIYGYISGEGYEDSALNCCTKSLPPPPP